MVRLFGAIFIVSQIQIFKVPIIARLVQISTGDKLCVFCEKTFPLENLLREDVMLRKSSVRRFWETKTPRTGVKPGEFSIRKRSKENEVQKLTYKEKKLNNDKPTSRCYTHSISEI